MKYVYRSEKGLSVLNEKIKDEELASITDLRVAIVTINEDLKVKWEHGESPLGFDDILGINLADWLFLKEGIFIWDSQIKEYTGLGNIKGAKLITQEEVRKHLQYQLNAMFRKATQIPNLNK